MTELRRSLYALVAQPPAAPVAIEIVVAHAARFRRRREVVRVAVGVGLVAAASAAVLGVGRHDSHRGVVLATEGATTAGYLAEQPGGYLATGTWNLTITRDSHAMELSSTSSDPCGPTGIILPGDEVRGSITGNGSTLRVGESFACPG
jgi:hypothetical protein